MLGSTVDAALAAGLRVIVVGRPDDARMESYAMEDRVVVLRNPDPERGMLSTLRVALGRLEAEAFFFMPGDMPFVKPGTFAILLGAIGEAPVVPTCDGRRGHPVLLPSRLVPAILGLAEGGSLRDFLASLSPRFVETGDRGILTDIDLPSDYEEARGVVGLGHSAGAGDIAGTGAGTPGSAGDITGAGA